MLNGQIVEHNKMRTAKLCVIYDILHYVKIVKCFYFSRPNNTNVNIVIVRTKGVWLGLPEQDFDTE